MSDLWQLSIFLDLLGPMKTGVKVEAKSTSEIEIPKNQDTKKEVKSESKETAGFDWKEPEGRFAEQKIWLILP